jgi:hypothetical protein
MPAGNGSYDEMVDVPYVPLRASALLLGGKPTRE